MSNETVRLTYVELAKARGITLAAARRMTLRHKWPKQIGNDGFTRVSVPASALARHENDSTGDAPAAGNGAARHAGASDGNGVGTDDAAAAAVKSLSDAVASLGEQLNRERERADRAEGQLREAERRVRELTDQLTAEIAEHRQMVALLLKRRWWPWRR
jgi:hypothetical protein